MLELVTFGRIFLRNADGRETADLLRHPKQLALLVYLAVEARPATRDELIGLFWPDATEQRARQSLSRAVSSVRSVLGAEAIVTDGNTARHSAPDLVQPDTAAFEAALAAKQWSDAVTLYGGEFLKGFLLPNAHEFEDWTSRIRERYRQAAIRALEAHSDQLRAEGDALGMASQLARACEVAPEREDLAAAAIDAFADAGQALAAVDWFGRYRRRFEEAFDEPPQPALAARIDQLRATTRNAIAAAPATHTAAEPEPADSSSESADAGRAAAPAATSPAHTNSASSQTASPQQDAASGDSVRDSLSTRARPWFPRRLQWPHAVLLVTIGVIAALAGTIWLSNGDTAPSDPRAPTTMLIRITNRTPGIGWPHLAEALEQTLAARMSNPPRLYVAIRPEPADIPQANRPPADVRPQATRQDVDFILAGTVHQTAEGVRIELRVSEGVSDRVIRTLRISRPRRDVFAVLDGTAEELADTLRPLLGSAIGSKRARTRTTSTDSWSDLEHSKALLADARRFATRGASARAAGLLGIADSLARRAIRADSRWIDARLQSAQIERCRSFVRLTSAHLDMAAASEHLADAAGILSDAATRWPDDARVHELAGTVAYERWLVARPRGMAKHLLDQAVRSLERAILLDPYAAHSWVTLSDVHAARGEHAASAVAAHRARERDAFAEHTDEIHNRLFHAYFELGQDEDAARWCDEINRRGPGRALGAFCELSLQGWSSVREPELAVADSLIENLDADPPAFAATMRPRLRMLQAAVAARVGEMETARRLLEDAVTATRRTGDMEAGSFHAAALVSLGELDTARRVLAERASSGTDRVLVERWFHDLSENDRFEP